MITFQNHDLTLDKFFIKNNFSEIITDIADLKNQELNEKIYYLPVFCPIANVADSNLGSCFKDYTIPTGSYIFKKFGNNIMHSLLSKDIELHDYEDKIYYRIKQNIEKIFNSHEHVLFCYSGGIDSLTILSYIISLGFLNKTKLVVNNNKVTSSSLFYNKDQTALLKETISRYNIDVDYVDIDLDYLIELVNYGELNQLKTYSTNKIIQKYNNSAIIGGWHGNQVLLHKYVFWDEIINRRPEARQEIKIFLRQNKNFYTSSLIDYNVSKQMVPIERVHMLQKPWAWLDNKNGNKIYSPLADDDIFQWLRKINFSNVSVETIAHALVARNIIKRNVGMDLDKFIVEENVGDGDSAGNIANIQLDKLADSALIIPEDLNHNIIGKQWLESEIEKAKAQGSIAFRLLMSIKTLSWLSNRLKGI